MGKIRILIADDIEETRDVIKKILSIDKEMFEVVGEAGNGEEVLRLIPKVKPDVVLMDINMPVLNGLEATEKISDEYPWVIVIILSVQGENEYLKKAMFYGAKEYIIKPFHYDVLSETIKVTYEKYKEKEMKLQSNQAPTRDAKVIAFFSSKGGVGKSVLALNTSIMLSKESGKKILLADMDLLFGDISMLVNQYNQKTILDVIDDGQLNSYENIKPYLYKYNENLDMLFAPAKPEAAEYIGKDSIEKMMKVFQKQYDVIIVDTGINFNDSTLYILDNAQTILYVTTGEIVALKNTKLGLRIMKSLGYDNDKVKLVINRFTSRYGISKAEVEEAFKDNIFAILPEEEKTVSISVNKGQPFCDNAKYSKSKSKVVNAIELMCKNLTG
ncbi:MAG: response regulator [Firmicutes bacterium]|nr:response regulator [Bacillota bacterium]